MNKYIGIFSALGRELLYLKKKLVGLSITINNGIKFFSGEINGHSIILTETGVGQKKAEHCVETAISLFPFKLIVSSGFATSLRPEINNGDIILGERTLAENGSFFDADREIFKNATKLINSTGIVCHIGNILTVDRIIRTTIEKINLSKLYTISVLEMESYAVAKVAYNNNIPFLSIKTVSDRFDEHLPYEFKIFFNEMGEISFYKIIGCLIVRPSLIRDMFILWKVSKESSRNLCRFIEMFLQSKI